MEGSPSSATVGSTLTDDLYNMKEVCSPIGTEALQRALEDARKLIAEQQIEINLKTRRIVELEKLVTSLSGSCVVEGIASEPRSKVEKLSLPESNSLMFSRSAPQTFLRDTLHDVHSDESISPIPTMSHRLVPTSPSNEGDSPVGCADNLEGLDGSKVGLDQRLAMSAAQRRKLQPKNLNSRSTGALRPSASQTSLQSPHQASLSAKLSPTAPMRKTFSWAKHPTAATLFIFHDNPQICKTLGAMVQASTTISGPVLCMLEATNGQGVGHFVLGEMAFSGAREEVEGTELGEERGSCAIVLERLRSCMCVVKSLPQRTKGDIVEVELPLDTAPMDEEAVRSIFRPCTARVDVILDPIHDSRRWFPYFEGVRKMAPQFRSRGVGYLRLGDDMSNFGTAFLSLDVGESYLDNGATEIVQKTPGPQPSGDPDLDLSGAGLGARKLGRTRSIRSMVEVSRSNSSNLLEVDVASDNSSPVPFLLTPCGPHHSSGDTGSGHAHEGGDAAEDGQVQQWVEAVRAVSKWSDRVAALQVLTQNLQASTRSSLSGIFSRHPQTLSALTGALVDQCKHSTPAVAIGGLRALEAMEALPALQAAGPWQALVVDAAALLRSNHRAVAETAAQVLLTLFRSQSFTLDLVVDQLEAIMGGSSSGNGGGGGAKKKSSGANGQKVLAWLQSLLLVERSRGLGRAEDVLGAHQAFQLTKCLRGLLAHREESTREAAAAALAVVLSMEVWQGLRRQGREAQARNLCAAFGDEGWRALSEEGLLSDGIASVLREVDTKTMDKVWPVLGSSLASMVVPATNSRPASRAAHPPLHPHATPHAISAGSATEGESPTGNGETGGDSDEQAARMGVRSLKRRLSSRCKLKPSRLDADPSPTIGTDPTAEIALPEDLTARWFESRLLLQRCPQDLQQWSDLQLLAAKANTFFVRFVDTARRRGLTIGELLQRVLPFNEHTSSADQASTARSSSSSADGEEGELVVEAIAIRATLRVKMADEADFHQAKVALATLDGHLQVLAASAEERGCSLSDLVARLDG